MKNIKLISLTLLIVLCLYNCKKEDKMFDGNSSIKGTAFFQNEETNTNDTACNVLIKLKNVKTQEEYNPNVNRGNFKLSLLKEGNYEISYTYIQFLNSIVNKYNYSETITLKKGKEIELTPILKWNNNTTALRLRVIDTTTAANSIANANVCLYTNHYFMSADTGTCAGSIRNALSDSKGYVFFTGLESKIYYYRTRAHIGVLDLSNVGLDTTTIDPLAPNIINSGTIKIK